MKQCKATIRNLSLIHIFSNKHLLSLKDMNRSDQLEALLDAGVSSLKIEGRLKDAGYVKNITAYYRKKLDAVLSLSLIHIWKINGGYHPEVTPW